MMPDPQAGEPDVGLRTLTSVGETLQYNVSSLWVTHLVSMQFDYVTKASLLSSHCGSFLTLDIE